MTPGCLDGIRVLDLTRLLPGPFMTMVLADMGADVIKIEAPGAGDYLRQIPPVKDGGMSGRYLAVNRNKRSLVLDLKSDDGRDALLQMLARADVVVESFRPGVMDKLGLGYETLRERNPAIILCSISGYGQTGTMRKRAGHDLNYIALAGVLAMGGPRGGAPAMPGTQIADLAGGALWAATAVLGALVGRERIGGQHLDISMAEGSLALLAAELGNLDCGASAPSRGTETLNGGLACYSVYRTSDDRYLSVAALEPKFWLAFNAAIGRRGEVSEVVAPAARQEEIRAEIAEVIAGKTRDAWTEHFSSYDCCVEPVLELDELRDHPLHQSRQAFFPLASTEGQVVQVRTPVGPPSARRMPPRLGEHSREVLEEFGFSEQQIAALVNA